MALVAVVAALGSVRAADAANAAGSAGRSNATPLAEVRFLPSPAADWRLDALEDYLRLLSRCTENRAHAGQELAALDRREMQTGQTEISLAQLLQGEGVTIDLTAPWQAHLTAAQIGPAPAAGAAAAGPAETAGPGTAILAGGGKAAASTPFIRARVFHMTQKVSGATPDDPRETWLTVDAERADFGILASPPEARTGNERLTHAGGAGGDTLAQALSWPFVLDLDRKVRITYRRAAPGKTAHAESAGAAGAPGTPGTPGRSSTPVVPSAATPLPPTGVMGELESLEYTAPRAHVLLVGDGRAGRTLFWSPPGAGDGPGPGDGPNGGPGDAAAGAAGTGPTGAAAEPARLEATFAGGVTVQVEATGLVVELAWAPGSAGATGGPSGPSGPGATSPGSGATTAIRWAGAGKVHLTIAGLRADTQAGSTARRTQRWTLTADAFALISLPAAGRATPADGSATGADFATAAAWPLTPPRSTHPTLLLSAAGRGRLVQSEIDASVGATKGSVGGGAAGGSSSAVAQLTCVFNRGLVEFERAGASADAGAPQPAVAAPGAAPTLQRAWLEIAAPTRPEDAVCRTIDADPQFYRPLQAGSLAALLGKVDGPLGLAPDQPLAELAAFGPRLAVLAPPGTNPAKPGAADSTDAGPAMEGQIAAERIALQETGAGYHLLAVSAAPLVTRWSDGRDDMSAAAMDFVDGTLTLHGAARTIHLGVNP
ncbi:MAG: hypothetical protein ACREJ2_05970 [Planctomycetota bacterium]